jgi:hypothetical protein
MLSASDNSGKSSWEMFANCLIVYFFLSHNLIENIVPDSLGFSSAILISGWTNCPTCWVCSAIWSGVLENIEVDAYFVHFPFYLYELCGSRYCTDFQLKSTDTTLVSGDVTWYLVGLFFFVLVSFDAKLVPIGIGESAFSHSYGFRRYSRKTEQLCIPLGRSRVNFTRISVERSRDNLFKYFYNLHRVSVLSFTNQFK